MIETVTIVGVGLIGGSLARVMKEKGLCSTVVGLEERFQESRNIRAAIPHNLVPKAPPEKT